MPLSEVTVGKPSREEKDRIGRLLKLFQHRSHLVVLKTSIISAAKTVEAAQLTGRGTA